MELHPDRGSGLSGRAGLPFVDFSTAGVGFDEYMRKTQHEEYSLGALEYMQHHQLSHMPDFSNVSRGRGDAA